MGWVPRRAVAVRGCRRRALRAVVERVWVDRISRERRGGNNGRGAVVGERRHVVLDLAGRERPRVVVKRVVQWRRLEGVAGVDVRARGVDDRCFGREGSAVERDRRKAVGVDEQRVVANCGTDMSQSAKAMLGWVEDMRTKRVRLLLVNKLLQLLLVVEVHVGPQRVLGVLLKMARQRNASGRRRKRD